MSTPPIRKRLVIGRPLTAEEHDANLDAVVHRGNHTGTQPANTISNLRATVLAYDFIQTLLADVDSLEDAVDDLENQIASNPTLSSLVSQVNSLASQLLIQEDAIEGINTALTTLNASLSTKVDRGLPNQVITARLAFNPPNTGVPVQPFTLSSNANAVITNLNADRVDGLNGNDLVQIAGSTMTGPLVLSGNPISNAQAANKGYVDLRDNDILNSVTIPVRYSLLGSPGRVVLNSGVILAPDGLTLIDLTGKSVNIPTGQTVYVALTPTGTLTASTVLHMTSIPLMQVTGGATSADAPSLIVELTRVRSFLPSPNRIKFFGGTWPVDLVYTSNTTVNVAELHCKDFIINAGVTVTLSQATKIYCSGNVVINGTLAATPCVPPGWAPGSSGRNLGAGSVGGVVSTPYSYIASPVGSSGAQGVIVGTQAGISNSYLLFHGGVTAGFGGWGGSSIQFEVAGTVTVGAAGTISARGGDATPGSVSSSTDLIAVSGNGGGSGGSVIINAFGGYSLQGTINVSGGNGSAAPYGDSRPGGAGGGGWIVLRSSGWTGGISTAGSTLNISGGISGAVSPGSPEPSLYGGGSGGAFGGAGASGGLPYSNGSVGKLIISGVDPR